MLLLISARPLRDAWQGVRGTALRPALVWALLALALAVTRAGCRARQSRSLPGRPLAERLTYLSVLALLAGLGSVLNARTPGGKAWAVLMMVLVVVFLIPWLEDQTRLRRATAIAQLHLDAPWSIFYGLLVVVAVTNYLPTRCGCGGRDFGRTFHPRVPGAGAPGLATRRARPGLVMDRLVAGAFSLDCALQLAASAEARSSCERLWFWFRDDWGVVWALRVLERFNRAAEVSRWPVRLTWFGLTRPEHRGRLRPAADRGRNRGCLSEPDGALSPNRGVSTK